MTDETAGKGKNMRIIGIAGKTETGASSGSGKSTVALALARVLVERGDVAVLDTFVQPVREYMAEYMAESGPLPDDTARRRRMQELCELERKRDPDCFVKALRMRHSLPNARPGFLVIADVRYRNEAEFCFRHGVLWLVEGTHRPLRGAAARHESERQYGDIDDFVDHVFTNDARHGDLAARIARRVDRGWHRKTEVAHG